MTILLTRLAVGALSGLIVAGLLAASWLDVLVGLDGSAELLESAGSVLATLGPSIGRLGSRR